MGQNALRVNGNDIGAHGRGINALEIDKRGNKIKTENFDTYGSPTTATDALVSFIETAQTGHILLFAINDHGARIEPNGVTKLQELGSEKIDDVAAENDRNNWGFITVKGGHALAERYEPSGDGPVTASVTRPNKFSVAPTGVIEGKYNEVGPAPDSLIGWWPLDGDLRDYSGNGNHGTNNGASITSGLGQSAYDFERGNNDYVNVGTVGDDFAVGRGDFTFAAWVKFETMPTNGTIFELSRYTHAILVRPDNGDWTIYMDNSQTNDRYMSRSISASTEEWVHFVVTRNSGTVEMYEDGVGLGTNAMDGVFEINQDSYIGMSVHRSGQNHDGELQDIRFYDRGFTDADVAQLYAITNPRQNQQMIQTQDGNVISKDTFDELL